MILVLVPALALAGERGSEAQRKLDDLDFDGAIEAARKVLGDDTAQPEDLQEAYKVLGLAYSATGRDDEAMVAFRKLLSIDSDFQLSPDISPKLAAPFYQALAITREMKPLSLGYQPETTPDGTPPGRVSFKLEADPMRLISRVRICLAAKPGSWDCSTSRSLEGPAELEFELPRTAGEPARYYFEALNEHGGVVARLGSRRQPLGERTRQQTPVAAAALPAAGELAGSVPAAATPWYQSWWFWTAVGVVVAGTAVGLGVGLSGGTAGPVDYNVVVQ
ncbi:MAG: hypothetical protein DRI34_11000 [Deltaproteobacteria bacterium]|nr:MAG: hypothetical protein DRI34_11000 [Deltaproteobacteria bacterium]